MAAITSGLNFSTLNKEGVNLANCYTINTTTNPEYPAMPFAFGDTTEGLDGSAWIFVKPQGLYAVGSVGYLDTSNNFYSFSTGNPASTVTGLRVGVLSQIGTVTASPTTTNYDGIWAQVAGLCPAISVVASTSANAQLYTTAADSARTITAMTGPTAVGAAGNQYVITATSNISYPIGTIITIASASPTTLNTTYIVTATAASGSAFTVTSTTATGTWSSGGTATGAILGALTSTSTYTAINGIIISTANSTSAATEPGVLNFPEVSLTT